MIPKAATRLASFPLEAVSRIRTKLHHHSEVLKKPYPIFSKSLTALTEASLRILNPSMLLTGATEVKKAAVLIPLIVHDGHIKILFTKRTDKVGTHKGQISFPGGHLNEDEDPRSAAVREFHEELFSSNGASACPRPAPSVDVLGTFETVLAVTGTRVTPVLGLVNMFADGGDGGGGGDDDKQSTPVHAHFAPNPHEVDIVFARSLGELAAQEKMEAMGKSGRGASYAKFEGPVYDDQENGGKIWGLTALILKPVLNEILLPAFAEFYPNAGKGARQI